MDFNPSGFEIAATVFFALAVCHTFMANRFIKWAHRFPDGSMRENLFHLLGEVEVVFGLWAGFFVMIIGALGGWRMAIEYIDGDLLGYKIDFTEPQFVFAIMVMAATKPILRLANAVIGGVAKVMPLPDSISFYLVALIAGPLLGSFITEPAAMTVTALTLLDHYYKKDLSKRLQYATLGLLFVNVSIGGTLTNFAAPPVLMVAAKFDWSNGFMMTHFGWKAVVAVIINASVATYIFRKELAKIGMYREGDFQEDHPTEKRVPYWLMGVHVALLGLVVASSHHPKMFLGFFAAFLGVYKVTSEFQEELKLKESFLVGFFLAGLVTLGGFQKWWLQPLISSLGEIPLYLGATGLTALTDNAALTYLGSLVEGLSESSKYALVAGAVTGGGLTVIANAPNPAGYSILKDSFDGGISPLYLLLAALPPTFVALICMWFLPNL